MEIRRFWNTRVFCPEVRGLFPSLVHGQGGRDKTGTVFLEQSYGFVNGVAIAIALGYLVTRIKIQKNDEESESGTAKVRWTRAFSVLFVLLALTYFNVFKNVAVWSEQLNPKNWQTVIQHADGSSESVPQLWDAPYIGRLPGVDFLQTTPSGWFNLTWALLTVACILIVRRHYRNPIPLIPKSSMAKGQTNIFDSFVDDGNSKF